MTHGEHCPHSHNTREMKKSRLGWAISINAFIMLCEVGGGLWANSLALLSDAGHMLPHVFALGMSYFAISLAARPADHEKTFGYFRAEVLAAFVNGIFLIIVTGFIVYEAVTLIMDPEPVRTKEMFFVAVIGLVANVISIFLLSSSTKGDINIRAAFIHVIGDAASSVLVVIGAVTIYLTGSYIVDPILSILISILILIWGGNLLRESARILLESSPPDVNTHTLKDTITQNVTEVIDVHDVHVWVLTSNLYLATIHVVINDMLTSQSEKVLNTIQDILNKNFNIKHANIQFEVLSDNCQHREGVNTTT